MSGQARFRLCVSRAIECAHFIESPSEPADPRRSIHGHSYLCTVCLEASTLGPHGQVEDADRLAERLAQACRALDHRLLNDVDDLDFASMEAIARYLFLKLAADGAGTAPYFVEIERPTLGYRARYQHTEN